VLQNIAQMNFKKKERFGCKGDVNLRIKGRKRGINRIILVN